MKKRLGKYSSEFRDIMWQRERESLLGKDLIRYGDKSSSEKIKFMQKIEILISSKTCKNRKSWDCLKYFDKWCNDEKLFKEKNINSWIA